MKVIIILYVLILLPLCYKMEKSKNNKLQKVPMEHQLKIGKHYKLNQELSETDLMDNILNTNSIKLHNILLFKSDTTSEKRMLKLNNDSDREQYIVRGNVKSNNGFNLLFDMKADIIKQGCIKLNSLAKKIKTAINITSDLSKTINKVFEHYVTELNTSFNEISKSKEVKSEIDWEFYFMHIIESSHKIFSSETKLLYESIMAPISIELYVDVDFFVLRETIQKTVDKEKKENLRYVCQNFHICRTYPTYSDNLSELLNQILQLPDTNIIMIIKIFNKVAKEKTVFLKSIMDEKMAIKIKTKLESLKDISILREFLSVVKNIISQRFILFVSRDVKANARMKALKVLIDIMDKTFEKVGNDYNEYKLFKVLKSITFWDMKKSVEIMKIFESHFKEMFNILSMNLFLDTREEIKQLIFFIITGSLKNVTLTEELLAKGAKFIQDDKKFLPINGLAHVLF